MFLKKMDGCMDGWTERRIDERMEGWMDGQNDV